jgi:light-harvesting protein B-800-850 alpha chain
MNQGRIWCVVNPTVGLPLFLGSVALTSLAVHYAVLTNTTWMSSFFNGGHKAKASLEGSVAPVVGSTTKGEPAFVITVAPAAGPAGQTASSFVITVAPNTSATAKAEPTGGAPPDTLALVAPDIK